MKYTLEVLGRLRPSRLREYARASRKSKAEDWYEYVRHPDPDVPNWDAGFDEWWSDMHPRRARVADFLHWLFQNWPGRPGQA